MEDNGICSQSSSDRREPRWAAEDGSYRSRSALGKVVIKYDIETEREEKREKWKKRKSPEGPTIALTYRLPGVATLRSSVMNYLTYTYNPATVLWG